MAFQRTCKIKSKQSQVIYSGSSKRFVLIVNQDENKGDIKVEVNISGAPKPLDQPIPPGGSVVVEGVFIKVTYESTAVNDEGKFYFAFEDKN